MAMATTNEILAQMADQIRDGLPTDAGVDFQVEPHHVASPSPPTVDMFTGDLAQGTESRAFGQGGELLVTVRVRVAGNDTQGNEELLNDMMEDFGDLSVAAALDSDYTLNGMADSLDFVDPTGLILYAVGGDVLPGRQFTVKVVRADP